MPVFDFSTQLRGSINYWAPDRTYRPGAAAMSPAGDLVYANVGHISGNEYEDSKWSKVASSSSVKDFKAVGDNSTDDTNAANLAIASAKAKGSSLYWPDGTYKINGNLVDFRAVEHYGPGILNRNGTLFEVTPNRDTVRKFFVSPTGSSSNDGLSSIYPVDKIQTVIDYANTIGPVKGRTQIIGTSGVYNEALTIPTGMAANKNYLEFKFPSAPGVMGDPTAWPAGGAILDGTGINALYAVDVQAFNKVYFEYLLVKNWFDTGLPAVNQTRRGIAVSAFATVYLYGCSASGNGMSNLNLAPLADATVWGGVFNDSRYGFDNTGGSLSLGGTSGTYTTINGALEYGLYSKHQASNVFTWVRFNDCGKVAGAEAYGSAIFAYKSNCSVDTSSCTFNRNNIVYNARGGHIARHPSLTNTYGSGADANNRIWKLNGTGSDDLMSYKAVSGLDINQSTGVATTTSTTLANIVDTLAVIPAGYLTTADKYLVIEITGENRSTSAATIVPTLFYNGTTNQGLGTWTASPNVLFTLRLVITPTAANGQQILIEGKNITNATNPQKLATTVNLGVYDSKVLVRGNVPDTGLDILKTRVLLYG